MAESLVTSFTEKFYIWKNHHVLQLVKSLAMLVSPRVT